MKRAFTTLELILVLAAGAALAGWLGPKISNKLGRAAKDGKTATAQVEKTTDVVVTELKKNSSEVASSLTQIKKAAEDAPPSPQTEFIKAEADVALAKSEKPDLAALERSYQRYTAFLEGQLGRAQKLIDAEMLTTRKAQERLEKAENDLAVSQDVRRQQDNKISEIAAVSVATAQQRNIALVGIGLLVIFVGWVKLTHWTPNQISIAATDMKKGVDPIAALDGAGTLWQQRLVALWNKFK